MSSTAHDFARPSGDARASQHAAMHESADSALSSPAFAYHGVAQRYRPDSVAVLLLVIAFHVGLIAWFSAAPVRTEPLVIAPAIIGMLVKPEVPPSAPPRPQAATPPVPPPPPPPPPPQAATPPVPPPPAAPPPVERAVSKPTPKAVTEPKPKPVAKPKPQPKPVAEPAPETESEPTPVQSKAAPPAPASDQVAQPEASPPQVVPPRIDAAHLDNPAPVYPPLSRRLGEQGEVLLDVYILPDGAVGEIKLKASSGYARLDAAAREAVQRWRYVPASRGGEPIAYWYVQPVVFRLAE